MTMAATMALGCVRLGVGGEVDLAAWLPWSSGPVGQARGHRVTTVCADQGRYGGMAVGLWRR